MYFTTLSSTKHQINVSHHLYYTYQEVPVEIRHTRTHTAHTFQVYNSQISKIKLHTHVRQPRQFSDKNIWMRCCTKKLENLISNTPKLKTLKMGKSCFTGSV